MAVTLNRYEGDGTTTSFAVTFQQYSWTSIVVSLDNVEQTSGYSYNPATRNIVFTTAPADGVKVTIRRLTDATALYKFGDGAAFTGSNIDSNFEQYQSAVEEVQNAADVAYVEDLVEQERAERQAADISLQDQITGGTPVLGNQISVVSWHGQTITNSIEVPANMNAFSVGPQIHIAPGQEVILGEGSTWNILGNAFEVDELYNVTANKLTTSDGAYSIEVSDLVEHLATLDTSVAGLTTRMTAEEGKTQPVALGGTGANTAGQALTNLGGTTIGTALFTTTSAANARSSINAAVSGSNADITALTGLTGVSPLPGDTSGGNAAAGKVGEYVSATGSATNLTSASTTTIVSITLSAGDWELGGAVSFAPTGGTNAPTQYHVSISTAVNTSDPTLGRMAQMRAQFTANGGQHLIAPTQRRVITTSTTFYLEVGATFPDGTMPATGFIWARRMR